MPSEQRTSTSARMLYRPWGLASSVVGGLAAGQVFQLVWRRMARGKGADPPKALESEYKLPEILLAAAVQGAIFFTVKAIIDRGGARLFERWTGEWPGD